MVNVTQIKSVDKRWLGEKIGTLSNERMAEVYQGLKLVMDIPKLGDNLTIWYFRFVLLG